MRIEEFLGKLNGVTEDGKGGYMACCPAHDDHNPSMHVNGGADGRILVKCFAGCTSDEIVSALGLKKSDLMGEKAVGSKRSRPAKEPPAVSAEALLKPKREPKKRDLGKLVCEYVYRREDGGVVYKVQRRMMANGKKTFIQMSPDPKKPGGWIFGVASKGVEYVPYQLPLIRKAAAASKPVVICEGEKDVQMVIERLHLAATCNAKGAGKWMAGFGKYFAGVPAVLIIADKDPETRTDEKTGEVKPFAVGQRHACDVERKLLADGFAGKIRKIVMPDVDVHGEIRAVKDLTDWAEAMDAAGLKVDKAAFQAAIEASGEWPSKWQFAEGELDLQGEQKAARSGEVASDMPGEGEGSEKYDDQVADCGRFGRPLSRALDLKARAYKVGFRIGGSWTVWFNLNWKEIFYRWDEPDEHGKKKVRLEWRDATLPMMVYYSRKMVEMEMGEGKSLPARISSELLSVICLMWLRSRGKFFWDENSKGFQTSMFFDEVKGVLMRVRSDEFMSFVATEAEINRESSGFKYLMSMVDDAAMDPRVSRGVIPSNMWDRRGNAVYVSSGDSDVYRIKDGAVEKVMNGTDGVVFMRGKTLAPWNLCKDAGIDPFANSLIFNGASWADKNGRMNVRLWVLNLFACHATKPLLLITGAMQSGKTRMAKAVKEILGVRQDGRLDLSVQQVEDGDKGLDAFWATVNDGKLEVFDNLDTKIKWVSDTLQNVATDGQTKRRTLYTTFGVSILRANAHIILTSNNPLFSTEGNGGMADRLISVHLETNRSASLDTELSADIARNRDEFMTWLARTVAAALIDKGDVDQSINRRHPDYGRFSIRCGRAFGDEQGVIEALGAAEADKSLMPLRNDMIAKEVLRVLEDREPPYSMRFTAGDMSEAILARIGTDEADDKSKLIYGSRRVGKTMAKYLRQFGVIFKVMEPRILDGKTLYEFSGLTEAGKLAMVREVSEVGKVDSEATFQKSAYIQTGAGGFSENGSLNPLNPLHARARSGVSSFKQEEEDNKDNRNEGPSLIDDDGDWSFNL